MVKKVGKYELFNTLGEGTFGKYTFVFYCCTMCKNYPQGKICREHRNYRACCDKGDNIL